MRKLLLTSIFSLVFSNILLTQTFEEIQNWANNQGAKISAQDVVNYIELTESSSGIIFGDEFIFHDSTTGYTSSAALGSNKFVIAFNDYDNNKNGTVVVGLITNDSVIFGSKYVFNPGYSGKFSCIGIDSNRFVISSCAYNGPMGGTHKIKSRVGIELILTFLLDL